MRTYKQLPGAVGLVLLVLAAAGCGPTDPAADGDPWADVTQILEVEPNGNFAAATAVVFDDSGRARLQGTLPLVEEGVLEVMWEADYYALGPMAAGDRIIVDVDTPASDLNAVAAVFDADGRLFVVNDDEDTAAGALDPYVDQVFRHDSDGYYLVLHRLLHTTSASGAYEIMVTVERGGTAPSPRPQVVLLNFEGAALTFPNLGTMTVSRFEAGDINAAYAGQTAVIKREIIRTVRQNYARFDVQVLNTDDHQPPSDGIYSCVYFGGYDPSALGVTPDGTDAYNADPTDQAIIFTSRFTPDLFTTPPDAQRLGLAIGNVAAHEIGHLLGLNHVTDTTALMNPYDAPDHLLTDQRFKSALLDALIFISGASAELALKQDAALLLAETVGLAPPVTHSQVSVGQGTEPICLAAADFDGDADMDLAVANLAASELRLLWNDGDGVFAAGEVLTGGLSGANAVVAGDFDGDADPDLAVANALSDSVALLLNEGGGTFAPAVSLLVQDGPLGITAADFDGDDDLDLAAAHGLSSNVSILLNQGNGTFSGDVVVAPGVVPLAISAADFDGDGDQDLAYANTGTGQIAGGVWVLFNNGDATYADTISQLALGAMAYSLAVADLNNDNNPDVVLVDAYGNAAVIVINDGAGGFARPVAYVTGEQPVSVAAGDLDGDQDLDLAVANAGTDDVSVLLNNGDGTFQSEWPYRVGDEPSAVVIVELDLDGDSDLAVASRGAGAVWFLLNNGDGTFGH